MSQEQDKDEYSITKTNCDKIRVELFKLNYVKGEFSLHDKGDASEAMSFMLTQMHTWVQFAN